MPWAEFSQRFDWRHPKFRRVTTYRAGAICLVSQACLSAAVAAGAAIQIERQEHERRDTPRAPDLQQAD